MKGKSVSIYFVYDLSYICVVFRGHFRKITGESPPLDKACSRRVAKMLQCSERWGWSRRWGALIAREKVLDRCLNL
jgi:hypothetical protein